MPPYSMEYFQWCFKSIIFFKTNKCKSYEVEYTFSLKKKRSSQCVAVQTLFFKSQADCQAKFVFFSANCGRYIEEAKNEDKALWCATLPASFPYEGNR